jgi:hypothetical protein
MPNMQRDLILENQLITKYTKMKCKHILVHRGSYDECEKCGAVRECSVLYGMPCGSKNPNAVALGSIKSKKKTKSSRG